MEGLRGAAALYVVLGHLCSMADPSRLAGEASRAPVWLQIAITPFAFGHLAVAAFIVVSGFCLQLSLFNGGSGIIKSPKEFFLRRARRILPAYYAALGLSILVDLTVTAHLAGMPFSMYLPVTTQNVLAHIFLVHNLSEAWMYKLNGVLWSIAIEAQLYLLFPLLVLSLFQFGRRWTVAGAAGLGLAALWLLPNSLKLYPWFLPLFAVGMAAAHVAYRPLARRGPLVSLAQSLCFGSIAMAIWGLTQGWGLPATDCAFGFGIACLCYAGTIGGQDLLVRMLSTRGLVTVGGFSYSLYLIHHPLAQVLYWLKPSSVVGSVYVLGYLAFLLPVILLLAWLFSELFEQPFMRRKSMPAPLSKRVLVPATLPLRSAVGGSRRARRPVLVPGPVAAVRLSRTTSAGMRETQPGGVA